VKPEPARTFYFQVLGEGNGVRLDLYLSQRDTGLSRSRIQSLIKKGRVILNGHPARASARLREGDLILLEIPPVTPPRLEPEAVPFQLLHEDRALLVLNKPAGVVVHPAPGHPTGTLVQGILRLCKDLSGIGGELRPGIVHRLDKDTSGLLVVAKNDRAHAALARQFKAGEVTKRYLALVYGPVKAAKGKITLPIGRHPRKRKVMAVRPEGGGKAALTVWEKRENLAGGFCLLDVSIKTGRTHQIRVHLSHEGHPIVGDPLYGQGRARFRRHPLYRAGHLPPCDRQMLHAERLGFTHPDSGDFLEFRAPLPEDMKRMLRALRAVGEEGRSRSRNPLVPC